MIAGPDRASVRYPVKVSAYSSHSVIVRMVGLGAGGRLLDIGCADGEMAEVFDASGWNVLGVEPFEADALCARDRGIEVLACSVEDAIDRIRPGFDVIVLGDVLEHLVDPWTCLQNLVKLCNTDARIIISLPNIAHFFSRSTLLVGKFDYADRGILDRTHLRFFTRKTSLELVSHANLSVLSITCTPTPVELVFPGLLENPLGRFFLRIGALWARIWPTLFGYQFVIECSVARSQDS